MVKSFVQWLGRCIGSHYNLSAVFFCLFLISPRGKQSVGQVCFLGRRVGFDPVLKVFLSRYLKQCLL